jgi:uncharacterized protein
MFRSMLGIVALAWFAFVSIPGPGAADAPIKILFLGDDGHHRPIERFRQLEPILSRRGIQLTYTEKLGDLNAKTLGAYQGLVIYANHPKLAAEQEQALLDFVAGGKGLIAVHCASACFGNSAKYIELVGAQFARHGTGTFRARVTAPDHPIMKGYAGFQSWDETYVHQKHNEKDRTVLEVREDGNAREPWTWVRTQGKGRVFYTAWGHDERTWGNPGFHALLERGVRWAVGADPTSVANPVAGFRDRPEMTPIPNDIKPFEYVDVGKEVPDYRAGQGKTRSRMQQPVEAAESLKHMVTPVGFEVRLFADENDLGGKPIAMNWDERGRLWVAVTVDYPNDRQPEGKGRDKIVICEDTKGTGRADKFTVFADKLSIPTSLTFARGGVIVHQAPGTLFLKASKGDDRADIRQELFRGWGTGDTHAGPSNLNYGLDNWIYGIVGYAGFNGTVGGQQHRFGSGFYRFRPDGSKLEFLRNTNNNSWGVGFSEEGVLFGSTANGNPSVHMPIANRYYEAVRGWTTTVLGTIADSARIDPIVPPEKVRQVDFHGSFTAGAGHALYTARTYPREYWNRTAFVAEPTGHLLATMVIRPDGASYRSRNSWNMLASDDEWTAPIAAEVGPDGNLWMIDWYAYIVQHNPTPPGFQTGKGNAYQTKLRDHKHGRIYRIVYKDAKNVPTSLADATPEQLVATLKNDNFFWRRHAQRLLVERGNRDVAPALLALVADQGQDETGLNAGAIHALWTLHGLGVLDGSDAKSTAAVTAALKHPSAGVRRNAVQVLPRSAESVKAILDAGLHRDADMQVRLAALLALADHPATPAAATALTSALEDSTLLKDRWLRDAVTIAAAANDSGFLLASLKGASPKALKDGGEIIERVAEHHARGAPAGTIGSLLQAMADAPEAACTPVLAGLSRGWPKGKPGNLDEATEKTLATLMPRLSPAARGSLVALALRLGSTALEKNIKEITDAFLAQVRNEKEQEANRIAAAGQLIDFRKTDAVIARQLLELLSPRTGPELTAGLLEAVGKSESPEVGAALLERLPSLTPTARSRAVGLLLLRTDWTLAMLDAAEKGTVQLTELSLDQKRDLASHRDATVAKRAKQILSRAGGLPNADRQKVVQQLMPLTEKKGDAVAGKKVFQAHCTKCHTHSGEGAKIGPDLTGMAVHSKAHLLVDIIDPSFNVEDNYRAYVLATRDGRVLTGLLTAESRTSIELLDAENKKHAVLREDIEELQRSPKSLMPDGFEKQVSETDLVNLLEFMTQRGKYLPLSLEKVATAVSTKGMFYSEDAKGERLVFKDWSPKTFAGVPFLLVDPRGDRTANVVLLYGPEGKQPPKMPKSVKLPCNAPAKAIHMLSGVSGWGYPYSEKGSVSLIVRLHYADGKAEDHELKNGEHFADYIRRVDVPGSEFAFNLDGRQVRYLRVMPKQTTPIKDIEFLKGPDRTAPVIMALTVESPEP